MDMSIPARVDRGVALLDERRPDWRDEINLAELDMSTNEDCILGQLYEDYSIGLYELGIEVGYPYGFDRLDRHFAERDFDYVTLNAEWRKHL